MTQFYTYIHIRKDTGEVFYVGKGKCNRHASIHNRNHWWKHIVSKCGFTSIVLNTFTDEADAFAHERYLIASYRAMQVKLCNMTDGGEGVAGLPGRFVPEHEREAMRVLRTGVPRPPGIISMLAEINKTRVRSPEEVERRRIAMLGNTNGRHLAGVKKSEETRERMRLAWIKRRELTHKDSPDHA